MYQKLEESMQQKDDSEEELSKLNEKVEADVTKVEGIVKETPVEEKSKKTPEEQLMEILDFRILDRKNINSQEKENKIEAALETVEELIKDHAELDALDAHRPGKKPESEALKYYRTEIIDFKQAEKKIAELDAKIKKNRTSKDSTYIPSDNLSEREAIKARERYDKKYRVLEKEYQEFGKSDPEAYLAICLKQIKESKEIFDKNGNIVETPFVKEKLGFLKEQFRLGRATFIHGELGTGKTELVKHFIRQYLQSNNEDVLEVRGLRSLEKEDITIRQGIRQAPKELPEKQMEIVMEAWKNHEQTVLKKQMEKIESPEEKKAFIEDQKKFFQLSYLENFKTGVETFEALSPIYQAMEEGRPVLIDEMNAIPHHVLIVLNDIINRKPGQEINTPQGRKFTIAKGFWVVATGNWKQEDGKLYVGRQQIDAAFLSRFALTDYDYLPQSINIKEPDDIEERRKFRQGNELYRMLVVRMLDEKLGVDMPEKALEDLKRLAQCARITQDVFQGDEKISQGLYRNINNDEEDPRQILKENVLSLRHLIPIVEHWKKDGFRRSLDDYIFLHYVNRSKGSHPKEMHLLYSILQKQGAFFETENNEWPDASDEKIENLLKYNIIKKMYGVDKFTGHEKPIPVESAELTKKYFTRKKIAEQLFGDLPEKTKFRKGFFGREAVNEEKRLKGRREKKIANAANIISQEIKKELSDPSHRNKKMEKEAEKIIDSCNELLNDKLN